MCAYLQHECTAILRDVHEAIPVQLEDGGEVLRVLVKEIFRRVSGHKLVTQQQDALQGTMGRNTLSRVKKCFCCFLIIKLKNNY